MEKIIIEPIGFVKNKIREPRFGNFANEISELILDKKFTKALEGIDDYSHIIVVYWMDKVKNYVISHRPQGNPEVPVVGIFACRCPARPNPIGITTVRLIKRQGNRIKVKGLDILDKTPIIDIKPYWPQYDKVGKMKVPSWVNKLQF
ncbi:MAG: tRNA (N6-threonylcarbamoyladenosine(37)-N6)-methyltransferase TrmO [bacterium]|nr:tRNA (N6-threonylcarbamoyladenosine(37)-N6)-methyltransferase TrmO [bacterium]